jgi:hypothetical protein
VCVCVYLPDVVIEVVARTDLERHCAVAAMVFAAAVQDSGEAHEVIAMVVVDPSEDPD